MIKFLNNDVRLSFHNLPLDRQRGLIEMAITFEKNKVHLMIEHVELITPKMSEVTIRIDEESNIPVS